MSQGYFIRINQKMMTRSFKKTRYTFREIPRASLVGNFGIYIHVPFCLSRCNFCPFYKEIFSEKQKQHYLRALLQEIIQTEMSGSARWIYFGGGTPNLLAIQELGQILDAIRRKVSVESIGIEILPAIVKLDYLKNLKELGFTKISFGVESFARTTLKNTGRKYITFEEVKKDVEFAQNQGLFVNIDLMVGLPNQIPETFLQDVKFTTEVNPDQITIYPFMIIRGLKAEPGFSEAEQFALIEQAGELLREEQYQRIGVWTFSRGNDVYDSSRDELVEDYIGFGPGAFSTYQNWKIVNPELQVYLKNIANGTKKGFVAPKSKATDQWRQFARMVYDLQPVFKSGQAFYIQGLLKMMRALKYLDHQGLTKKGIIFAHYLTKTVVESLPFPLQNPQSVSNYQEYISERNNCAPN